MSNTPLVNTNGRVQDTIRIESSCGGQIFASKRGGIGVSYPMTLTQRLAGGNVAPLGFILSDALSARNSPWRGRMRTRCGRMPGAPRLYVSEPDRPVHRAVPVRRQGATRREHRKRMRLHAPVSGTGGALSPLPGQGTGRAGLPGERLRRTGTGKQR